MKKFLLVFSMVLSCIAVSAQMNDFPKVNQKGKIAIVAHRGFWKCEEAGFSENSIASLVAAQNAKLWGSECDIHLTADDVVIVNHDPKIQGVKIAESTYADLVQFRLPNGECRPTLNQYLQQARKGKTKLIIELKKQPSDERESLLVEKTIELLKANRMYSPKKVLFITFSMYMSEILAKKCPEFVNQFLTSDNDDELIPSKIAAKKINGVDYQFRVFRNHPMWVGIAHENGMSVNAWTVNKEKDIKEMIDLGMDAITTNEPLLVRSLLGEKEFVK